MSWSHDHYPKAHWCGARARNPDVNRCPKSLRCFGLLKAWVSDFDPANSSLPYVHSELISDIMIHIWIHIWYGDHQSSTQSFWIHIWHCWWYVGDMSQMISTLYRCFFLPSFAPQRQRQPGYGRQDSPSNFTPVLWPQATITRHRAINAELKLIRHLRRDFKLQKRAWNSRNLQF